MKKQLLISIILLSVCFTAHSQDGSYYDALNVRPDYNQRRQDAQNNLYYLQQQNQLAQQQLADKRLKASNQILQIKQWYMGLTTYPLASDGKHSAYVTDNDFIVLATTIIVKDGKVINVGQTVVSIATAVANGKCQITIFDDEKNMHILDVYFID